MLNLDFQLPCIYGLGSKLPLRLFLCLIFHSQPTLPFDGLSKNRGTDNLNITGVMLYTQVRHVHPYASVYYFYTEKRKRRDNGLIQLAYPRESN